MPNTWIDGLDRGMGNKFLTVYISESHKHLINLLWTGESACLSLENQYIKTVHTRTKVIMIQEYLNALD